MSAISTFLAKIKTAVYGEEVRDAIHDSIEACYTDVTAAETLANTAANNANTKAGLADVAATRANSAAASAENMTGLVAPTWVDNSSLANVGDPYVHNGALYWCITPITTGEVWTAAHWSTRPVGNVAADLKSAIFNINNEYTFTKDTAGQYNFKFNIRSGKTYYVRNNSTSAITTIFTRNTGNGSDIETISSGMAVTASKTFTATQDASYIGGFMNAANGSLTIREVDTELYTIKNNITNHETRIGSLETNVSAHTSSISSLNTDISYLETKVFNINNEYTFTKDTAGQYNFKFNIRSGKTYYVRNNSTSAVTTIFTRNTGNGSNIETISSGMAATASKTFTATQDASYIGGFMNAANGSLTIREVDTELYTIKNNITNHETRIGSLETNVRNIENTYTYSSANAGTFTIPFKITAGRTYVINNTGRSVLRIETRSSASGETTEIINEYIVPYGTIIFTASYNANYLYGYSNAINGGFRIDEKDTVIDKINTEIEHKVPLVRFSFNNNVKNVSAEVSKMDYSAAGRYTVLEQVYDLFDDLVADYPEYVSKVDAAELVNLSYPEYANGISTGHSTYMETPAYKTYMYKLIETNTYAGNGASGNAEKKKLLLIGATHGNEHASPFNLYILAKELCNDILDDDIFKLRASFDIYIIPCLNGYGMYHRLRGNGDLVDINRNYPIVRWSVANADRKEQYGTVVDGPNTYTGPSAGSEFETQLVMAITNLINPDVAIDHHNYGNEQKWQYYGEAATKNIAKVMYRSLSECSYTFIKELPQYFGTKYKLFQDRDGSAPGTIVTTTIGNTCRWWHENGVPVSITFEICWCINYLNGAYAEGGSDMFGNDTFKIAEFSLRNVLLHLCQYLLEN